MMCTRDSCCGVVNPKVFAGKRILVLGASGLIGSTVIQILQKCSEGQCLQGAAPVRIAAGSRSIGSLKQRYQNVPYVDCYQIDVLRTLPEIGDFDFIINAASPADPASFSGSPAEVLLSNVIGIDNISQYAYQHGNPVIVHISSGEVYGFFPEDHMVTEAECGVLPFFDVRACYPMGKRAAETLCLSMCTEKSLDIRIARLSHVFGPNFSSKDSRISADFFRTVLNKENIILQSSGNQRRTYIFSEDCASGILSVASSGCAGQAYNVTNSKNVTTIRNFAEQIAWSRGLSVEYSDSYSHVPYEETKLFKVAQLSDSKLRSLGWLPTTNLEEGIHKTLSALE